ncbi:MAG: hypothetical protein EBR84_01295 [Actinobacteria bacterium]|nr:hypothetical protein [Actinomycetota bacterium]
MPVLTEQLHVGVATHIGPISIFPVWTTNRSTINYTTQALNGLEVNELNPPRVDTLSVTNKTDRDILIPEGTVLFGGLQTRVLTCDTLLLAGRSDLLEVRCIEQGRWGNKVPTAFAGRTPVTVMGALRGLSRGSGRHFRADQGDVWQRVNYYEKSYGTRRSSSLESIINMKTADLMDFSDTSTETKVRENLAKANDYKKELAEIASNPLPGQNGVIIGLSGHPVLLETFSSEEAFREQFAAILDAIAIDAPMASETPTSADRAFKFAKAAVEFELSPTEMRSDLLHGASELLDVRSLINPTGEVLHTVAVNAKHKLVRAA